MKKVISLIITLVILAGVFPLCVGAYNVGDVVGYALSTDIAATINGYDIPSYNVDGYTYVVVEDLRYYGFAVNYDNSSRSLSVSRDYSQAYVSKVYEKPYVSTEKVGAKEHQLLYTDIVTYLDGYYVHSYNINGQTIIRFDALAAYGGVSYDNNKREIFLSLPSLASNPNPVDRRKGNSSVIALKEYANSIYSLYYAEFDTFFTDIRFKLADVSGDGIPELLAVGIYSGEIEYIEVFSYSNGIVSSIFSGHCQGAYGGFVYPIVYNEQCYIIAESYSSASGFYQSLKQYNGTDWVDIHSSYTDFDYSNGGILRGYVIDGTYVSEQKYDAHRNKVENGYMKAIEFVKSGDL